MNANKNAKRVVVDNIKEMIKSCNGFVVVDYKGLTVKEDTEFRSEFRKENIEYKVLKNTLLRLALNELGYTQFDVSLNGPTAVAFAKTDALGAAKIACDSVKKYNKMTVKCGLIEKNFADASTVQALANIPSKQALYGMLANVLSAPVRKLAIALDAVAQKQSNQ